MKFFKPEDFVETSLFLTMPQLIKNFCEGANAKLEREGLVIDGTRVGFGEKALLISLGPIAKCTHPSEKVVQLFKHDKETGNIIKFYNCDCGARVKPKSFEVCGE